jgi:guanosine-3',5'-bis(diphosphate) 3'-pyrophosphohydrolase
MFLSGTFIDALQFVTTKHSHQRRKDAQQSPYVNHLVDVVDLLWHQGGIRDEATLLAGLLHDTLEDTEASPVEIRARYGEAVLKMVQEVTDDRRLPRAERKRQHILHAPHLSYGARCIKLADKSANVHDLSPQLPVDWTMERRRTYLTWAQQVVSGLRGTNPGLESHFDQTWQTAHQSLSVVARIQPLERVAV